MKNWRVKAKLELRSIDWDYPDIDEYFINTTFEAETEEEARREVWFSHLIPENYEVMDFEITSVSEITQDTERIENEFMMRSLGPKIAPMLFC